MPLSKETKPNVFSRFHGVIAQFGFTKNKFLNYDLPLLLCSSPWNLMFWAHMTLPVSRGLCNPCKISWSICLLWSTVDSTFPRRKTFGCFRDVMVQFEVVGNDFLNKYTLYVHQSGFKITRRGKQCTTCQHTNFPNTTNHDSYLSLLEYAM